MFQIDAKDQLLVADCIHAPGFQVLLKLLESHKELLETCIENAKTDVEERRLVTEWKCYRSILANLQEISETVQAEPQPDVLDPFDIDRKEYVRKMLGIFGNIELGENEIAAA